MASNDDEILKAAGLDPTKWAAAPNPSNAGGVTGLNVGGMPFTSGSLEFDVFDSHRQQSNLGTAESS
jgi:hypothetical protein